MQWVIILLDFDEELEERAQPIVEELSHKVFEQANIEVEKKEDPFIGSKKVFF
jgi:5S rRNA maturation endonuclease (ribonuclease M5)